MSTKNLGTLVSGYRDPDGRNWEQVVYQSGKPIVDAELNLEDDLSTDTNRITRVRTSPSGWVSGDFLGTSSSTSAIFTVSAIANELDIPQDLQGYVNGWTLRIGNTNTLGSNILDLGAGPAGAGAKREDLIVLEVWRRLIAPAPGTDGKSPAGRIWWYGNVKIAPANDLLLNFTDDILDGAVGSETTKRVQVQYRLRVIQGVDLFGYPYGMDDPSVVANSVPAAALAPDGVVTLFAYTNQSANGDPGLWRAGDGNPANTLGTVDGYMYAVPLMAVVRRNTTAFDKNTNHNGGVVSPGPSDRPDLFLSDIIEGRDIVDLRFGVSPDGWDYSEVLEKNLNFLFDNVVRTEIMTTLIGGGVNGNTVLWADEIGITNAHGGDGTTTGDTPGAEFVGEFDAVRRRFSDRSISETVVLRYTGGPWAPGNTITIDPSALPVFPYAAFNYASYSPASISFDIQKVFFIGDAALDQTAELTDYTITNLGTVPPASMTLTLGTLPAGLAGTEDIYVYMTIEYPTGVGLSKTPLTQYGFTYNNPAQLPAAPPVSFSATPPGGIVWDFPHRELQIVYRTVSLTRNFRTQTVTVPPTIPMPERVYGVSQIRVNTIPYVGIITISADGYTITLNPGAFIANDFVEVDYEAVRPFPQNDEQITIYYEARAPQTIREAHLGVSLTVNPRYVSPHLYTLTVGSGSQGEAYPFPSQYVQVGSVYPTSAGTWTGDHELDGSNNVSIADYSSDAGFIQLPVFLRMVANPEELTFLRAPGDIDSESRTFFKEVPSGYIPSAASQSLSEPRKHKVVLPILAELTADSSLGLKGQLVVIVISQLSVFDERNAVGFIPSLLLNTTCSSVYRLKGCLLNRRS